MLSRLFGRGRQHAGIATELYGAIVAQAREPALYAVLGVPDTVSGRFEMVLLHAFLVLTRLHQGSAAERETGQEAFDVFCADMDRSLRELGVGDLGVPRRMRQVGEAFYGRSRVYDACIAAADEEALASALARNVLKAADDDTRALPLARYVMAAASWLGQTEPAALLRGPLTFADPASFAAEQQEAPA